MAKKNTKPIDFRVDTSARLAGGYGPYAAKQDAEALLRRSVMANLLWEKLFYEDGESVVDNIRKLIPRVDPEIVFNIAVEARTVQKLRHVPLLIAREMARLDSHKMYVSLLLPKIILRADELSEFLAIYWENGRQPLSAQVKKGLAEAFKNFNEYNLAKYNRDETVKLRDVLFLSHAKPQDGVKGYTKKARKDGVIPPTQGSGLFDRLVRGELATPDTWEVALSSGADKKTAWERLIKDHKLGALAFVRNLRNMTEAGVSQDVIQHGFDTIEPYWLLPINYLAAAKAAPKWERELEKLMLKGLANVPKLPGYTVFVVDVSGSMSKNISDNSTFSRKDVAAAMAILATEMCEHVSVYVTAGNDRTREHNTKQVPARRGFALSDEIVGSYNKMGGGGIFTRQCLEYIKSRETIQPDRIIIFSDSQDCDIPSKQTPAPFGKHNYIVDVSAHDHGINYKGLWTAEISGWSEHFLTYIAALEGAEIPQSENIYKV